MSVRDAVDCIAEVADRLQLTIADPRGVLHENLDHLAAVLRIQRRSVLTGRYVDTAMVRRWALSVLTRTYPLTFVEVMFAYLAIGEDPAMAALPLEVLCVVAHDRQLTWTAETMSMQAFGTDAAVVDDGLLAPRIEREAPFHGDGVIRAVTFQHRDLVEGHAELRPDPRWGRPMFEWRYAEMRSALEKRRGIHSERLLWVYTSPVHVALAEQAASGDHAAARELAAQTSPGEVAVLVELPAERALVTSEIRWDMWQLRGRYAPSSTADAAAFFDEHATFNVEALPEAGRRRVARSWDSQVLSPLDPHVFGTQAVSTHVATDEILAVIPLEGAWPRREPSEDPGLDAQRLEV